MRKTTFLRHKMPNKGEKAAQSLFLHAKTSYAKRIILKFYFFPCSCPFPQQPFRGQPAAADASKWTTDLVSTSIIFIFSSGSGSVGMSASNAVRRYSSLTLVKVAWAQLFLDDTVSVKTEKYCMTPKVFWEELCFWENFALDRENRFFCTWNSSQAEKKKKENPPEKFFFLCPFENSICRAGKKKKERSPPRKKLQQWIL